LCTAVNATCFRNDLVSDALPSNNSDPNHRVRAALTIEKCPQVLRLGLILVHVGRRPARFPGVKVLEDPGLITSDPR
jgi:hypothetical protein